MQVNCSSSCKEDLSLGLETQWLKDELESGPNWKLFELSEIGEDSSPLCFENCGTMQSSASATITVYCEWQGQGPGTRRPTGHMTALKTPSHLEISLKLCQQSVP